MLKLDSGNSRTTAFEVYGNTVSQSVCPEDFRTTPEILWLASDRVRGIWAIMLIDLYRNVQHSDRPRGIWVIAVDWFVTEFATFWQAEAHGLSQSIDLYRNFQESDRAWGMWLITIDWFILYFATFWQVSRDLNYHNWLVYMIFCSILSGLERSELSELIDLDYIL